MMSSAWSVFVVVLTVLNTLAAVWLLVWMRKRRGESDRTTDTTGHVWDGDLREYNNPLPRWWLWLFVITVIFAVGYAFLYPTLGNSRGALGWTGRGQWQEMQADQERRTQAMLARFADRSSEELARDPAAPLGGDVGALAFDAESGLENSAFFLCGGENLVKRLKRALFMGGASMRSIRSDVFSPGA